MKIINKTTNTIYYQVACSGTGVLSGSDIIASGYIEASGTLGFPLQDAGKNPIVFVKGADPGNEGNIGLRVEDGDSTVLLSMVEVKE
jgi:hypothetical protein